MHQSNYRPDIDGLRALAVLAVVIYHAFPELLTGGFVGVDVFFVISGYLITGILLADIEQGRFSIARFYERRVRRVFPALLTVLSATLFVGWYVCLTDEYQQLGKHVAAGMAFTQNIVLWHESGYFDKAAELKPLLHLWSLAVEEQFYIFWPLLVAWAARPAKRFISVTVVIGVLSFVLCLYMSIYHGGTAYYSPLTRFWELMIGGALAYLTQHQRSLPSAHTHVMGWLGLLLIVAATVFIDKHVVFPGWVALLPTLGAALIIGAGRDAWSNRVVLSNRPAVALGKLSYPLYLWHWPCLVFLRISTGEAPGQFEKMAAIVVACALSWLTYEFVETPIRFKLQRPVPALSAVGIGLFLVGLAIPLLDFPPRNELPPQMLAAINDWAYPGQLRPDAQVPFVYRSTDGRASATLFIGDSHIEQFAPRITDDLARNAAQKNRAVFVTDGGCPPVMDVYEDAPIHQNCRQTRDYAFKLAQDPAVMNVVLGACWNCYFLPGITSKRFDYYTLNAGQKTSLLTEEGADVALQTLAKTLRQLAVSKRVFLLLDNPSGAEYDPKAYIQGTRLGTMRVRNIPASVPFDSAQAALRKRLIAIAGEAGATVIDPTQTLCSRDECRVLSTASEPIYKDHDHLRPQFVRDSASYIDTTLE